MGAFVSALANFMFTMWNLPTVPRAFILQDPIGFAFRPNSSPLMVAAMLVGWVVLVALVWVFVWRVAAGSAPGHGTAAFFGTWGAVVAAAAVAGLLRAPLVMTYLQLPSGQADIMQAQFYQLVASTAMWAVTWGWIPAAVVALVVRLSSAATAPGAPVSPAHS